MVKIVEHRNIPLDQLEISKGQVRLSETEKGIDELADSIRTVGLLEPIVVAPPGDSGKYEIILGQRRFLAHVELGLKTITAGILSEHVEEIEAKVLSVTENLIRRDLNRRDLIDVCTHLYMHYGTIQDVVEKTGIPRYRVSEYVKFDRLIPELQTVVSNGEAPLKTALRAQDAVAAGGDFDPDEAVKLAKEMSDMSNPQQVRVKQDLEADPTVSVDQALEQARTTSRVKSLTIILGGQAHESLNQFAQDEGSALPDAAAQLIEEALAIKGYEAAEA